MKPAWARAAEYSGLQLTAGQAETMERYGQWLADEAIPAGGIGPGESDRIEKRHLGDSLLFASLLPEQAYRIWDLGSGVGLPGIPLAIAMPDRDFILIDRSGRRAGLLRRVLRVLDLQNSQVVAGEIDDVDGKADAIVARASLPPDELGPVTRGHLTADGVVICAGSWRKRPAHPGWATVEIPRDVLDQPIWLLMMRQE